jgi:hypothetical protein
MRTLIPTLLLLLTACAGRPPSPPPPAMTAKEVQAEQARLAAMAQREAEDRDARASLAAAVRGKSLASTSLLDLVGTVVVHAHPRKDPQFSPVRLALPGAAPVEVSSAAFTETYWVWDAFGGATRPFIGGLGPRSARGWANRQRDVANLLLHSRLGGDLFDLDKPGTIRRAPLEKLLAGLAPKPKQKLWGTTARSIYPIFRPVVREYASSHAALVKNGGRDRLLDEAAAYETANPGRNMAVFYHRYAKKAGLSKTVHLRRSWTEGFVTGFWLRRMRDGTDGVLLSYLADVLAQYDPKFKY